MLGSKAAGFTAASAGSPITARPFVDATNSQPAAERVAFPDDLTGSVTASVSATGLLGTEARARANLANGCTCRIDLLAGSRFLRRCAGLGRIPSSPVADPRTL